GLRDLHAAVWLVQAANSVFAARVRGDRAWEALKRYVGASDEEVESLKCAKEFLFRVRNALHALSGAERDQLVVTRQEEVAGALGYRSLEDNGNCPPVERF